MSAMDPDPDRPVQARALLLEAALRDIRDVAMTANPHQDLRDRLNYIGDLCDAALAGREPAPETQKPTRCDLTERKMQVREMHDAVIGTDLGAYWEGYEQGLEFAERAFAPPLAPRKLTDGEIRERLYENRRAKARETPSPQPQEYRPDEICQINGCGCVRPCITHEGWPKSRGETPPAPTPDLTDRQVAERYAATFGEHSLVGVIHAFQAGLAYARQNPPAATPEPKEQFDVDAIAVSMHEWARLIRLSENQQELLAIADDIEINANALGK